MTRRAKILASLCEPRGRRLLVARPLFIEPARQ
jgi:hypothetical protein